MGNSQITAKNSLAAYFIPFSWGLKIGMELTFLFFGSLVAEANDGSEALKSPCNVNYSIQASMFAIAK